MCVCVYMYSSDHQWVRMKAYFLNLSEKSCQKLSSRSNTKNINIWGTKKSVFTDF